MDKRMKVGILLIAVLSVSSGLYLFSRNSDSRTNALADARQELSLGRPAFAQSMAFETSFLYREAGIAVYFNTTGPLNLNTAKNALINVENATDEYVIGSLQIGPSSDDYPHCFVHRDGWIVVYYLKVNHANEATAGWLGKMIDWSKYQSSKLQGTYLTEGLDYMATQYMISAPYKQYYHFEYPSATKLLFVVKSTGVGTSTFNIYVPGNLTVYERSWSCTCTDWHGYIFQIDTNTISSSAYRNYGGPQITEEILSADMFHVVKITANFYVGGQNAYVCLLLLYST
jgi:hypothetical protein